MCAIDSHHCVTAQSVCSTCSVVVLILIITKRKRHNLLQLGTCYHLQKIDVDKNCYECEWKRVRVRVNPIIIIT